MNKLGFGLMRLPVIPGGKDSDVDMTALKRMVDTFVQKGFTYFDTAIMYAGMKSQSAIKEALVDRYPRSSFTLATKLHSGFFNSRADMENVFSSQLEQTGAGFFDYYLLHGIDRESLKKYEQFGCFEWMQEKKAAGLVKRVGFSFHGNAQLLDEILTAHPEVEFVQLQVNYLDWESEFVQSRAIYETAVKHGKPVIVMEPVKDGSLVKMPPEAEKLLRDAAPSASLASWAIRFAASLPGVMVVLSGMSTPEQVDDNTSFMSSFVPVTEAEKAIAFRAAEIINSQIVIPCTGCSYCTGGCPKSIPIPKLFSLYNDIMREDMAHKGWTVSFVHYRMATGDNSRAKDCVECGQCESVCPQHLNIIESLKKVSKTFDR